MNKLDFLQKMTYYLKSDIPFFFLIDFEKQKLLILPIDQTKEQNILFDVEGYKNYTEENLTRTKDFNFNVFPISFEEYKAGFEIVRKNLMHGNTYLLNLTYPTRVETNYSLKEIFFNVSERYKLLFEDKFVLFSPETFIKIDNNKVFTYPMKGTIDATIPNAEEIIKNSRKELFEHYTVVDLLRNDLAIIAENIEVKKFRFIDKIKTHKGEILQVSSEIQGYLRDDWKKDFAYKSWNILPAGSISGSPKPKTIEIIRQAEGRPRGYYTGVFGIYRENKLYSAVNIRYIENTPEGCFSAAEAE